MNRAHDPLLSYLRTYCDVNALGPDWQGLLARNLKKTKDQASAVAFKRQLSSSILNDDLSLTDFEAATHWGLDTQEDMKEWLTDLWRAIYGDEPLSS